MSAWGKNGSARSCEGLLRRVEENDPKLRELVILPMKKFGSPEVFRLAKTLQSKNNTHLRSLQASGHSIEDSSALEALGNALTHVESLAIGDSSMGDEGICALCRGIEAKEKLGGSNALNCIDLSWKNIGEDGMQAILKVLAVLPTLEFVDLSRNEGIGPSFDFLQAKMSLNLPTHIFPGLKHLDLSECLLDAKSCMTLLEAMTRNDADLKEASKKEEMTVEDARNLILKLNSNNLSDRSHFKEMMNLLARGNLVTDLYLSKCQIGDAGLMKMVKECCCSSNFSGKDNIDYGSKEIFLKKLDLSYNNLTDISCLTNQFHRPHNDRHYLSKLRSLDLSGNPIGQNIEAAILCNPQWVLSLEELDLSHTSCEISGAVELVRRSNSEQSSLRRLNLFGNKIGSEGFLELSKVLHGGHLSLEYFDLGGNGATESGVVALVDVLKNKIESSDKDGIPQAADTTCENKLRVLVVGGNEGGEALESAIKGVQKVHPDLDIARDKPKQKDGPMMNGNMFNNTPGTTWIS